MLCLSLTQPFHKACERINPELFLNYPWRKGGKRLYLQNVFIKPEEQRVYFMPWRENEGIYFN
jgi:hypothetical protein